MGYVNFEMPKDLEANVKEVLITSAEGGNVKKGANEVTKAIERGKAKLVVIAGDVNPEEVVVHLPALCDDKGVAYAFIPTKEDLGQSVGLKVGTTAVAIIDAGSAETILRDVTEKLKALKA